MKSLIASAVALTIGCQAFAAQSLSTKITNSYNSLRALGMGNAFTAVADDYSLIMYNPAGFARKPYNEVQISLIGAGVSAKTLTIAKDISDASDTPGTDNDKAQAISNVMDQYYGETLGGKLQALEMFWVRKNWGIALLPMDLTVDMSVNRQLGPTLDLNIKGDTSMAFGYGQHINKELDAGITAKYIHRVSVEQSVSALELATNPNVLSEDRFKEGTALDFDIGFMWTPDITPWIGKKSESIPAAPATPAPETTTPPAADATAAPPADPSVVNPAVADPAKPADDKAAEEKRTPQAEDAAVVAQTDAEKKPEDTASAEKKAEQAATTDAKTAEGQNPETPAGVVKLGEGAAEPAKPEEVKKEEVKPEEQVNGGIDYPLTVGLVVHNVLGGNFSQSTMVNKNATDTPNKLERVIDIGTQYRLIDMEDFKIRAMVDFKNILHPEASLKKSFHTGVEFDYSPNGWFRSQFRVGFNQMYYTAGATLLLGVINFELVTYGEEVGTDSNAIENRVMAAKLGMNF